MTTPSRSEAFEERIARANLLGALLERVGYTFWQLAECEDALAIYVVLRLKAARDMGAEKGQELLASAYRRTFGSLLRELVESGVLAPSLESRLNALLTERNWLVHHAKRESRGVLFRSSDFDRLVDRLDRIAQEATLVQKLLADVTEEHVLACGVDRAVIDAEATKLARSWGYV